MESIRAHNSQFHNPHSSELETRLTKAQFLNELENRSRYFGSLIGVEAGEPFFCSRNAQCRRSDRTLNPPDEFVLLTNKKAIIFFKTMASSLV